MEALVLIILVSFYFDLLRLFWLRLLFPAGKSFSQTYHISGWDLPRCHSLPVPLVVHFLLFILFLFF